MAIDRLRSPYNNMLAVKGDVGPSAYSNSQVGGVTPFNFVGDGSTNTIVGVTYRCHVFEYSSSQNYSITFNRAGAIDLLTLAGGGGGGGNNAAASYGAGGGGSGGLILYYGYGVTASTYSLSVGALGQGLPYYTLYPNGGDSVFGALTAVGGGTGNASYSGYAARSGGSGGGGASFSGAINPTGAVGTAGQGFQGGNAKGSGNVIPYAGGGGGGYTEAGDSIIDASSRGDGGDGLLINFDGQVRGIAGGGGGGGYVGVSTPGNGGLGGGGNGSGASMSQNGFDATGFGNGGGGAGATNSTGTRTGGDGSPGLVIIRYALG